MKSLISYMAVNQINKGAVKDVCLKARDMTPYPDTEALALTRDDKAECCRTISEMMSEGAPVSNLKSAFPYIINNNFPVPCYQ